MNADGTVAGERRAVGRHAPAEAWGPSEAPEPAASSAGAPWRPADTPPTTLEAQALTLRAGARWGGAPGGRLLIDRLHLAVRPGERWVVLGPNGAGKSTLLAALAGVLPPASGEVRIDARPLRDWLPAPLASRRSWCPQFWSDPFVASVAETAALAMPVDPESDPGRRRLHAALAALDLVELAGHDVRTLSGGERQRVALATALLQGAPLLLLDEPASHLDLLHQQGLVDLLRRHAAAGGSVVASVHDLNLAWDLGTHAVLIDGHGRAWAGGRDEVLQPDRLTRVFGVPIHRVEVCGEARFWLGAAAGAPP